MMCDTTLGDAKCSNVQTITVFDNAQFRELWRVFFGCLYGDLLPHRYVPLAVV